MEFIWFSDGEITKANGRALQNLDGRRGKENIARGEQCVQMPRGGNSHGVFWGQGTSTVVMTLILSFLYLSIFCFPGQKSVFGHGWR